MANIERIVNIIFGGEDEQLNRTIRDVRGSLDSLDAAVHKVTGPLAVLGDKILEMDAILIGATGAGLVLATKSAGEFSEQIQEVATLTDMTADDVEKFSGQVQAYANTSTSSIEDINSALYQAISLGIDYESAIGAVATAEKLAIAGRAELGATTELLAGTLNAYGASVEEASKYSDVFFETVRLGKTTIPELATSLSRATGIAASAGIPIESLTAALAALTATGMPTEEAITGLRSAISEIIKPSSKASAVAADLGIQFNATALESKGFSGVLQQVYKATGGNVDQMGKLFGNIRGFNAAVILGADNSGKFAEALLDMQDAAGSTQAAYSKMADNFGLINQNLANNIKTTLIGIGDPILDSYGSVADAATNILSGIDIGIGTGAFDQIYEAFETLTSDLVELLNGIAEALPEALSGIDYSELIEAFGDISETVKGFFEGVDLTRPEDLRKVIQGVVDSIESLVWVTSGIVEKFEPVWNAIKDGISYLNDMDDSSKKTFGGMIGLAQQVEKFGTKITATIQTLEKFGGGLGGALGWMDRVGTRAGATATAVGDIVKSLFDWDRGLAGVGAGLKDLFWDSAEAASTVKEAAEGTSEAIEKTNKALGETAEITQKLEPGFVAVQTEIQKIHMDEVNTAITEMTAQMEKAAGESEELPLAFKESTEKAKLNKMIMEELSDETENATSAAKDFSNIWVDDKGVTHLELLEEATKNTRTGLQDASKDTEDFKKKVEEMSEVAVVKFQSIADVAQTKIEWGARIDIEQIKADASVMESTFKNLTATLTTTSDLLGELTTAFAGVERGAKQLTIEGLIRDENARREAALEMQQKLTDAQVKLLEKKTMAMSQGESIVNIDGTGLKPHLEAFMWEILEAIQVRVNEEYGEFLLGI